MNSATYDMIRRGLRNSEAELRNRPLHMTCQGCGYCVSCKRHVGEEDTTPPPETQLTWQQKKDEWLKKWSEAFNTDFYETVNFDHIQGKSPAPWMPRWMDKLVFAVKWGWRPWHRKPFRVKKEWAVPDVFSGRLCHNPRGGAHRKGARTRTCDNCGGPL